MVKLMCSVINVRLLTRTWGKSWNLWPGSQDKLT